ncbi:Rapid ALkalinization Factor [Corchorus capsularis]|uniref:Rapid ALkalinization Factor n=1 Tax=Corchorus capsularis TaxID=210143 RepID=A0A1R3IWZ6_COCAP|nr:Rapid ALkalinization Factor [Corchorus capsularis]
MRNFKPFLLVLSAILALLVLSGMLAGTPFISPGAMKKNKSPPTNSGSAPPAEPYQRGCIQANGCRGSSPSEKEVGNRKLLSDFSTSQQFLRLTTC